MSISTKMQKEVQFLADLDPAQHSVSRQNDELTKIEKYSTIYNFFCWFIYLITFTLVPRNRELDEITHQILKEISEEINNATAPEKELTERALLKLGVVINQNGASAGAKVDKLLKTIEKIQALPDVQILAGKPQDQVTVVNPINVEKIAKDLIQKPTVKLKIEKIQNAPMPTAKKDTKLQQLLQSIIKLKDAPKDKHLFEIYRIFPMLKDFDKSKVVVYICQL